MKPETLPLIPDQLANLTFASLLNARDLIDDAMILAEADRAARAFALTVFSLEELGKAWLCWECDVALDDEDGWRAFWREFRDHRRKHARVVETIRRAATLLTGHKEELVEGLTGIVELVGARQLERMESIYVDLRPGGVLYPAANFDAARVKPLVGSTASLVWEATRTVALSPDEFLTLFSWIRAERRPPVFLTQESTI